MTQLATSNSGNRNLKTIYPVILSVPYKDRKLTGRDKVLNLSRHARCALKISSQKSGIFLKDLLKDKTGAPLPSEGNYWSLTHKTEYAGGVVAPERIGIDVEKIRPCSESLFRKTADDREWNLAEMDPFELFFRYWTSKEAALKAVGTGIRDLSKCRIANVIDDKNLIINYIDKKWHIEHFYFDGHIASVVKNVFTVKWILITV